MTDGLAKSGVPAEVLVRARQACAADEELRKLFVDPASVDWLADNLSVRLSARWGGRDFGLAWDVALYLAAEFFRTREAPVNVTDRETGEAIANLPANAVWVPAPVVRESGHVVQPRPRLRPDIEAALIQGHHDRAREQLALRSEVYHRHSDQSLSVLTTQGRTDLASKAYEAALQAFPSAAQQLLPVSLGSGHTSKVLVANASLRMPDLQAMNLRFDFALWLEKTLVRQWCHAVAGMIIEQAEVEGPSDVNAEFWIGSHEQIKWALTRGPAGHWVFGERLVGVCGTTFALSIPTEPVGWSTIITQMVHDRWEIEAQLPIEVSRLSSHIWLEDAPVMTEHMAQVVR